MADSDPAQSDLEPTSAQGAIRQNVLTGRSWVDYTWLLGAAVLAGLVAWTFRWLDLTGLTFFQWMQGKGVLFGVQLDATTGTILAMATVALALPLIMWTRDRWFPGTQGTGIPQAIAALHVPDGPVRRRMLSMRIAIGKALLLTVALFTGATVGREGPTVHVAAICMYMVSKCRRLPDHFVQRGLILGGGGAGIAAAFNAPIAGMVFAFEEIGRSFEKNNAGLIVRTVLVASLVVISLLGWDYLFYGAINKHYGFGLVHWLAVPCIAVIGGLAGGLFARSVIWGTPVVARRCAKHPWKVGLTLGVLLAGIGFLSDGQSYGSGYPQARAILMYRGTDYYALLDVPRDASDDRILAAYQAHNATNPPIGDAGAVNDAALPIQTAFQVLSDPDERAFYDTWHMDVGDYPWWYPFAKAGGSFVTLISGVPGGLFDPSLSVGAGLGNLFADSFESFFDDLDPQFIIMMFMVAYFAGVVQSPITVFVIMIEMTDARFVTLPLMATAIVAYECSRLVCRTAIYEALAKQFLGAVKPADDPPKG